MLNDFLSESLKNNGYALPEDVEHKLSLYVELLQRWNKVFNLTAITETNEIILLHILDSLSIHPFLWGKRLIDIGTGGGFPGIPLALMFPEKEFVLLDSNNKKTRFLTQVIYELDIKNTTVVHSRCEKYSSISCFDSIISRAFATLKEMLLGSEHLLCQTGRFLAMKGKYPEQEINEIPSPFKLLSVEKLKINGINAERHLVCMGLKP